MVKTTRVLQLLNYRLKITVSDGRVLIGQMLAFDKHMNLVLSDTEEFRTVKPKKGVPDKQLKRVLGLVILRGETIVSLSVESPPPAEPKPKIASGTGMARPAGRGIPPPIGAGVASASAAALSAPVRGVGGAPASAMSSVPPPGFRPPPPGMGAPPGFPMGQFPPPGFAPPPGFRPPPPGMAPPPGFRPPMPPGQFPPPPGFAPPPGFQPPPQ